MSSSVLAKMWRRLFGDKRPLSQRLAEGGKCPVCGSSPFNYMYVIYEDINDPRRADGAFACGDCHVLFSSVRPAEPNAWPIVTPRPELLE